jgi:hypothetical protein
MDKGGYPTGTKPPEPTEVGGPPDPTEVDVWKAMLNFFQSSTGEAETVLEPGHLSTLSLFSELRYALGTPPLNGVAPQQQLTSTVQRDGTAFKIVYAKNTLPTEADKYALVYSDGITKPDKEAENGGGLDITPAADGTVTINLDASPDPLTLLAVKIKKQREVLLVSFVTRPAPQA